jgi:hypothetical protein
MCLFAATGHLALAILSLARGRQSVVARPLALLCFALFIWNFAAIVEDVSDQPFWGVADATFTALSPALLLNLVATFVGASRARARWVVAAYVVFGALALSSATGLFTDWGRKWEASSAWAGVFLAAWTPALVVSLVLLVRHLADAREPEEKARTRTFLAAFALVGALATTDELCALGLAVPRLAPVGTLIGTFLVATAVFRFRLFERDLSVATAVYAATLASAGLVAYFIVLRLLGGNVAAFGSATAVVTLALVAAGRELATSRAVRANAWSVSPCWEGSPRRWRTTSRTLWLPCWARLACSRTDPAASPGMRRLPFAA